MRSSLANALGILLVAATAAAAQTTTPPKETKGPVFKGCLQGDANKGFALLTATGDGSGSDSKGQTMTYKVIPPSNIDLSKHVNKIVEIDGALSPNKTGAMPAPVTDTVRGTAGAGGTGKPGENTAFYYANGTLTAKAIREISSTCAVRSAPDGDKRVK